jgi:hypothetical protein
MAESTRHNIGSVTRSINIPTLALLFVHPDIVSRFEFRRDAEDVVNGVPAWVVDYHEQARPTLIKTTPRGAKGITTPSEDLPMRGKLWIDPATGVVLKTQLIASDISVRAQIDVTFRDDPKLGLWVPAQMNEAYQSTGDDRDVIGTATYQNYRRFQVSTDEVIKKPGSM